MKKKFRAERIRIPVAPDLVSLTSTCNIAFQQINQQQKNIPPSYDTLYGNKINESIENKKLVLASGVNFNTNNTTQNTISRSNSINCGFSASSRSSSSMSTQNSKSTTLQKSKNEQQGVIENNNDLPQKLFISTERELSNKNDLSPIRRVETSPIRRVNTLTDGHLTPLTSPKRIQRHVSDLTAGSLPPTGPQLQLKSKNDTSKPVAVASLDKLIITHK